MLLDHGARVDVVDRVGRTALMNAARDGRLDVFQLLLQHGADPTRLREYHIQALKTSPAAGQPQMAELLNQLATEGKYIYIIYP